MLKTSGSWCKFMTLHKVGRGEQPSVWNIKASIWKFIEAEGKEYQMFAKWRKPTCLGTCQFYVVIICSSLSLWNDVRKVPTNTKCLFTFPSWLFSITSNFGDFFNDLKIVVGKTMTINVVCHQKWLICSTCHSISKCDKRSWF